MVMGAVFLGAHSTRISHGGVPRRYIPQRGQDIDMLDSAIASADSPIHAVRKATDGADCSNQAVWTVLELGESVGP